MGMNFPTFRHTEACRQHPFFKGTTKGCCFYFLGTCTYHTFTSNHVLIVTTHVEQFGFQNGSIRWIARRRRISTQGWAEDLGSVRNDWGFTSFAWIILFSQWLGVQYYAMIIGIIRYTLHPLAALMYCYPHIPVMIIPLTGILCIAA